VAARSAQQHNRTASALAALLFACGAAFAQSTSPLDVRLAEIREVGRFMPARALAQLHALDAQIRPAPLATRAEYLYQLCLAQRGTGHQKEAMAVAEELMALGRQQKEPVALAKGTMCKGFVLFRLNQLKASHEASWEGERIAYTTADVALQIQATITSGQSYAEEGNFPAALSRLQNAAATARQFGRPVQTVMALNALAQLYTQMKEYDKGFEALAEAERAAEQTHSPGRMASLKLTEYGLAIDSKQPKRALAALLTALEQEREIGADAMVGDTLVNLADNYLKARDYKRALDYALQALQAGRDLRDPSLEATARVNIGQAQLGLGRLAEGKRNVEQGMAYYEQSGDKPELQTVLLEYGAALEQAGDMAGAVRAYHRERAISNELFEKQRQKAVWELQQAYEADKKERQIELLQRDGAVKSTELDNRKLQQRVWWLVALVFGLAAIIVGLLYRKVRYANAQLEVKNLELKQQGARDPLTGLYNRRHFQEYMAALPLAAADGEHTGALFLLDVDHFKHINDSHGHAAGDAVLKAISASLREILRETDMIVRWGGEEFLAYLPSIPRTRIEEVARRLLAGIAAQTVPFQDAELAVQVSIGFAPYPLAFAGQPLSWERAVNLIDMALYLAKSHGRNRAYGVRAFTRTAPVSLEEIEQDLERAWKDGHVDLAVLSGPQIERRQTTAA
jgi:diguanylate cyclase (GGDEF)-like protein